MRDPYAAAEDALVRDFNEGRIDQQTFNEEMRSMAQDMRREAEEAAQEAYDEVMGRW